MKTPTETIIAVIGALALLTGWASVQETGNLPQAVNSRLTAGVGGTVLRIAKEKNLPNAFGRANGTSTTSLAPTIIPVHPPQQQVMDDGSILIAVELGKQNQFTVEGRTITIESADSSRLVYVIQYGAEREESVATACEQSSGASAAREHRCPMAEIHVNISRTALFARQTRYMFVVFAPVAQPDRATDF